MLARKKKIEVGKLKFINQQVCKIEVNIKYSAKLDFSTDMYEPDLEENLTTEISAVSRSFKENCKFSSFTYCETDGESYSLTVIIIIVNELLLVVQLLQKI